MVRRDDDESLFRDRGSGAPSSCAFPAGESPVPVGAGAPGSRPQVWEGDLLARAGCQKPVVRRESCGGEQARGPQREVKPAASKEKQSGSRAAHVTVKATSVALVPERVAGPGGVRGAARVQGGVRNTGGPSRWPLSRQGGPYKPRAKSGVVERESEGVVVLGMAVGHNAVGGKGPCGG